MCQITAIYGSPRRKGNTTALLKEAVAGAREQGATVNEFVLRDEKISPCLEIYGCTTDGKCVIKDNFHKVRDSMLSSGGVMLASPIFFYTVSAHTKIFMDRCQSLWVKKYWIEGIPFNQWQTRRKGLFISAGATRGKKLFDGALLTVKYFFDVIDASLWKSLLYRGLDFEKDVFNHPEFLEEAHEAGAQLVDSLKKEVDDR